MPPVKHRRNGSGEPRTICFKSGGAHARSEISIAARTQDRDVVGEAVTADVSSRAAGSVAPRSAAGTEAAQQRTAVAGSAQDAAASQQAAARHGTPQHAAAAASGMEPTLVVHGSGGTVGGPQQHTSHSSMSDGSGTSGEATVTINNNPRLATPALTGIPSNASPNPISASPSTTSRELRGCSQSKHALSWHMTCSTPRKQMSAKHVVLLFLGWPKSEEAMCAGRAGRTDVSSSSTSGSSANGEAETLNLKLRASSAKMAAAGPSTASGATVQLHASHEEPTVVVNRTARPGIGRSAFSGGLRAGPRRTGGAQRHRYFMPACSLQDQTAGVEANSISRAHRPGLQGEGRQWVAHHDRACAHSSENEGSVDLAYSCRNVFHSGLGGGAARVVLQRGAEANTEAAVAAAALTDSGRKRKAEADAQAASLPSFGATGGLKRRLAPEVNVSAFSDSFNKSFCIPVLHVSIRAPASCDSDVPCARCCPTCCDK